MAVKSYAYLMSHKPYFWQWEEGGDVVGIPGGNTVVYREYLVEVLKVLAEQGLPPLGSLLLAIIATNSNGKDDLRVIENRIRQQLPDENLDEAFRLLYDINDMPEGFRSGEKRLLLFIELFADCHNMVAPKHAPEHIKGLKNLGSGSYATMLQPVAFNEKVLKKDLSVFRVLAKRFSTVEELAIAVAGLPEEVPVELPEEPVESPKDFVEELIEHYKSFHVGALIKSIWSGLDIPFHHQIPSEQPIGGVSDLTNKGEFDRLLVSEFANDDLVFLSRLANNEALFISREVPPTKNKMKRIILLDVSLKCWGTPKTMAHAVMLAIARHPKSDFESEVFAVGNSVKPLVVDSRDEILEGLLSLDSALSANEGLNEFFKEYAPSSTQQIILITSKEAVRSKELQRALSHHGANINFRIATDVDGSIALHKNQGKSLKHVQDIKLPLERLWERSLAPEQAPKEVERQLVENMPILNPSPNLFKSAFVSDDGQYYVVTKKGDLLRLYQPNQDLWNSGWERINGLVKIPPGLHDAGTTSDGELVVICYIPQQKVVHIVNLTTQKVLKISFAKNTRSKYFEERSLVNQFLFFQDAFHCHTDHKNWTITLAGEVYEGSTASIEHLEKRLSDNKTRMGHLGFQSVLRNPKSVWISTDGNLVLNMHHLVIDHHRGLIWETNHSGNAEIYARHIDKDAFEFSNGCRIEMNHHGVCRLTGYDQVPDIYIPTPIDYALGVATEAEFAGNPYFRKHTLHRLTLIEPAKDKLNTVKTLSKDARLSRTKSKVIVTEAPAEIGAFGITVARNIKDSLELIGAKVAMEDDYTVTPLSQIEITTEEFYKKYIKRFIQNIRNHGT